jgi:four helix bundle protein
MEQLEAAGSSMALNIAEGRGRYSKKEFIQFL